MQSVKITTADFRTGVRFDHAPHVKIGRLVILSKYSDVMRVDAVAWERGDRVFFGESIRYGTPLVVRVPESIVAVNFPDVPRELLGE